MCSRVGMPEAEINTFNQGCWCRVGVQGPCKTDARCTVLYMYTPCLGGVAAVHGEADA